MQINIMVKASTNDIIETLAKGEEAELFLIQNSWVRGGVEEVNVVVGTPGRADLIISPTYYEKFMEAHTLDETLSHEEIEQDLEMLGKMMKTAYLKMIGGRLQLRLD